MQRHSKHKLWRNTSWESFLLRKRMNSRSIFSTAKHAQAIYE